MLLCVAVVAGSGPKLPKDTPLDDIAEVQETILVT